MLGVSRLLRGISSQRSEGYLYSELSGAVVSAGSCLLQKSCFHNGWFPAAPGKVELGSLCVCDYV